MHTHKILAIEVKNMMKIVSKFHKQPNFYISQLAIYLYNTHRLLCKEDDEETKR